jgi:hypothetical protein
VAAQAFTIRRVPSIATIDGLRALVVLDGGWRDEYGELIERRGLSAGANRE